LARSTPDLSVIVPAFNEERLIGRQVSELRRLCAPLAVQIIVADNYSSDRTADVARQCGADQVISVSGTVAAVRNRGAAGAEARVLIFMDADVFPTSMWSKRLRAVVDEVAADALLVTGSWVSISGTPTWIEQYWFKPLENGSNSHINSGHLIVSRDLFAKLGGFDERLRTGEDFDFSMRALSAGARMRDDPTLKVIHEGYPKSLGEFFRRELWHGSGDCRTLTTLMKSRVALVGASLLYMQLAGVILSVRFGSFTWIVGSFILAITVSGAASFARYRTCGLRAWAINAYLYYVYFVARGLSPYAFAGWKRRQQRHRDDK
jgi:glycosyltransferase involved in cell wall biosynthesis